MERPVFQIVIIPDDASQPEELIFVDGTLRESHALSSILSEYPVGRGAVTTDHSQSQPRRFTADLYVSETPLRALERELVTDFDVREDVRNYGGQDARTIGPSRTLAAFERARALFDRLDQLRESGALMTLTTAMGQMPDAAITRIDVTHESSESASVIAVEWQQITIADSEETLDVEVPRLRRARDAGQQNGTAETTPDGNAAEAEDVVPRSTLDAITEVVSGFF